MRHNQFSILIKPASGSCQLRCRYCFYRQETENRSQADYGIMSFQVVKSMLDKVIIDQPEVEQFNFMFQGGEPTMAGLNWFENFVSEVKKRLSINQKATYGLQTNGLLLDESWLSFLLENDFLVGISIDGPAQFHDANRIDATGKPTFELVNKVAHNLTNQGIRTNVLTVLTETLAQHPDELYDFYQQQDYNWIQLIPCLNDSDNPQNSYADLKPASLASFYKRLFDRWCEEYFSGYYRSISLFEDLVYLSAGQPPLLCGMTGKCHSQLVVEADGSVYPCDFYMTDMWRSGNLKVDSVDQISNNIKNKGFINRKRPYSHQCESCPFWQLCGGFCPRFASCLFTDDYCGYQDFLRYVKPQIQKILRLGKPE